jgi:hypothetical protein
VVPTGSDLPSIVRWTGDASTPELACAAGYDCTRKDGNERLILTTSYETLLEAKVVSLGEAATAEGVAASA